LNLNNFSLFIPIAKISFLFLSLMLTLEYALPLKTLKKICLTYLNYLPKLNLELSSILNSIKTLLSGVPSLSVHLIKHTTLWFSLWKIIIYLYLLPIIKMLKLIMIMFKNKLSILFNSYSSLMKIELFFKFFLKKINFYVYF
jgi:hypothetical protein